MSCQLITVLFVFQGPCWGVTSTVLMEPAPALLVSTTALAGGRGGPAQESRDKEGPRLQEKKTPGPEIFFVCSNDWCGAKGSENSGQTVGGEDSSFSS